MSAQSQINTIRFLTRPAETIPEIDRVPAMPHPREMLDLIGHGEAEAAFLALHQSGKMHHAFLLTGQEGVGKATFAYRAARFLLQGNNASNGFFGAPETLFVEEEAKVTPLIAHESHPDLAVLRRGYDPKTKKFRQVISVEDTLKTLELFQKTAAFGGWRVIIVDSADDLNTSSANALLKTLEEPPKDSIFFLISHQPQNLLPTIRSRCRTLLFHPLEESQIRDILIALKPDISATIIEEAIMRSAGSVRKALRFLEPGLLNYYEHIEAALMALPQAPPAAISRITESLKLGSEGKQPFVDLLDAVELWLASQIKQKVAIGENPHALAEAWAKMRSRADVIEEYNLDRRAYAITLFEELSPLVTRQQG